MAISGLPIRGRVEESRGKYKAPAITQSRTESEKTEPKQEPIIKAPVKVQEEIRRETVKIEPAETKLITNNMAWKPKTIAGKIIKGAAIAGGSILGLAGGLGAVKGIIKGTGALSGINSGIGGIRTVTDRLKESAGNLLTGTTKEQRQLINAQKAKTKAYQQQLETVEKLVNAGATPGEARAMAGLAPEELKEFDGEPIQQAGMFDFLQNKTVIYIAGALLGLFILSKLKK
jgi:hypothetical protein